MSGFRVRRLKSFSLLLLQPFPAGCSKRPDFSPAQPWRAETRLLPSKAAASDYLPPLLRGGWDGPNCAQRSHPPNPGRYFSPALPSDCFAIDFPGRAICPGEGFLVFPTSPSGEQPDCPSLRASDEHRFIVRVLRARRAPGRSLPCWRAFSASCYEFR